MTTGRNPTLNPNSSSLLQALATARILLLCVLLTAFFLLVLFPHSGIGGIPLLDHRFHYGPDAAYQLFASLDAGRREAYLTVATSIDMLFPPLYGLTIGLALHMAMRHSRLPLVYQTWLPRIPFLAAAADWSENIAIAILLHRYPERLDWLATVAGICTTAKWLLLALSISMLIFTVLAVAWRKHRHGSPE